MILTTFIIFLSFLAPSKQSRIVIDSIKIRHLRKNDFGLIFDALISNKGSEPKQTLNFDIISDKCCLLINGTYECDTQNAYGVKISNLEPDKQIPVSLLWPTLILYNRVGNCTINAISHRADGTHVDDTRMIHFNTTITTDKIRDFMFYYFNDMKDKFGYQKCDFEDLNPFNKCKPIDCELKYFGKRNYFQNPHCVPVKVCENDPNVIYDYETNSCRNLKQVFSIDELKTMHAGIFNNFIEETNETVEKVKIDDRRKVLKRVRRSLNESQTFADMILSSMLFIIKIVSIPTFL
ncbi:unnamed protein product [Chironomus riparius]|uniref:Uncharacterized protein n=1 Tax=Chironomus riparius TaxID=315576 RepID=A0A9N9RS18_9DIPT|nr:unnamed protein product [Chironomus riparius]